MANMAQGDNSQLLRLLSLAGCVDPLSEICLLCEYKYMDEDGRVYSRKHKFFFTVLCKKSKTSILIIYDAGTDNKHTFHREGTLSASLKRLCDYFECSSSGSRLSEHRGETDTHCLCFCWCWILMCICYPCVPVLMCVC